jgi:dipeptide/tripeptide permease
MTIIRHDDHHQEKQPSILRNKVILSILITETAERVAYFGFRAVLVLYFHNGLQFSESTSVSLFAAVSGLAYFSPLVGALFADSAWGRYLTILRFGAVYSIGLCLVTFAAYEASSLSSLSSSSCSSSVDGDGKECIDTNGEEGSHDENSMEDSLTIARLLSCFGLVLVCIGTGGIKPCVSAFGADQVVLVDNTYSHVGNEDITEKLPAPESSSGQEADRIREFFNSFYFCINVGALLSFAIIPIIRANYGFGAAFFIPTICMIAALGVFLSQRKSYKHRKRDSSQPSLFGILKMCSTIVLTESCYSKYFVSNNTTTTSSGSHMSVITANEETSNDIEEKHPVTTEITKIDDNIENNEENNNNIHKERQDAEQVLHIMPLMLFFPIFWMLYDQQGSVWTLQATRLNRHGLEPEQSGVCIYEKSRQIQCARLIFIVDRISYIAFVSSICPLSLSLSLQ